MPNAFDLKFFERWFVLLAKNKLAAALLPISGISIGLFLVLASHIVPAEFVWLTGIIGVLLIWFNSLFFSIVTGLHIFSWARQVFAAGPADDKVRVPAKAKNLDAEQEQTRAFGGDGKTVHGSAGIDKS